MLVRNHTTAVPETLQGPVLMDDLGLPRFWSTVRSCFSPSDEAVSTASRRLADIDDLYTYVGSFGNHCLDDVLAAVDVDALSEILSGYFIHLKNRMNGAERRWRAAFAFIQDTLTPIANSAETKAQLQRLASKINRIEAQYSQLRVGTRRKVEVLRALPRSTMEAMYEILDPECTQNPFRSGKSRWRAYMIFIALLHLGLRRGELLIQPVDAVKSQSRTGCDRTEYWLNVVNNNYEDDPRFSRPSIKTVHSIRQIPVSHLSAQILSEYIANYRGRPRHSFLINSQRNRPLSAEAVTSMFRKITSALPKAARADLLSKTGSTKVTPHDLRHTCAVVRLTQLRQRGDNLETALQKLRVYFGWSRDSQMPQKYARAYFEDALSSAWLDDFDGRVAVLRSLPNSL